jgi:dephospho-CoA kinase
MLVIGLTGGIGTGKSEVSKLLEGLGAVVIDADQIGHQAYAPGTDSWQEVVSTFGDEIVQLNGEIDRGKLGSIVFSDPSRLAKLNQIMHPRMAQMVADQIARFRDEDAEVVVVEAALLFEAGWDSLVDEVWTTDAPVETVLKRVGTRSGMSEGDVRKRIASQMDRQECLARSHVVVENSGNISSLNETVQQLWQARVQGRIDQK